MTTVAIRAVVIGGSAGAVQALLALLPRLPVSFDLPVIVVVHLPPDGSTALATLFRDRCQRPVEEAEDKVPVMPGVIYFAPSNYHLLVEADGSLSLSAEEPVNYSRPSIDVLFETAADAYGTALAAILLTGANEDGARGLRAVGAAGGVTVVQDPLGAYASTMPAAGRRLCPDARVLTIDGILEFLQELRSA